MHLLVGSCFHILRRYHPMGTASTFQTRHNTSVLVYYVRPTCDADARLQRPTHRLPSAPRHQSKCTRSDDVIAQQVVTAGCQAICMLGSDPLYLVKSRFAIALLFIVPCQFVGLLVLLELLCILCNDFIVILNFSAVFVLEKIWCDMQNKTKHRHL